LLAVHSCLYFYIKTYLVDFTSAGKMANVQVSEAEKEDNPLPLLDISSEEESKKTGDVVAVAASIMEPQKSEQPDILKQLLGSFDLVCGAPKFQKIINTTRRILPRSPPQLIFP